MTALSSPPDHYLTIKFSEAVEFKLFSWFDEAFSARARLNRPLRGVRKPIQRLFPRYDVPTPEDASARVSSARPRRWILQGQTMTSACPPA
jgi:hypothetical protein